MANTFGWKWALCWRASSLHLARKSFRITVCLWDCSQLVLEHRQRAHREHSGRERERRHSGQTNQVAPLSRRVAILFHFLLQFRSVSGRLLPVAGPKLAPSFSLIPPASRSNESGQKREKKRPKRSSLGPLLRLDWRGSKKRQSSVTGVQCAFLLRVSRAIRLPFGPVFARVLHEFCTSCLARAADCLRQ